MPSPRPVLTALLLGLIVSGTALAEPSPRFPQAFGPDAVVKPLGRRGDDPFAKMNRELQMAVLRRSNAATPALSLSDAQMARLFGVGPGVTNPWLESPIACAWGRRRRRW